MKTYHLSDLKPYGFSGSTKDNYTLFVDRELNPTYYYFTTKKYTRSDYICIGQNLNIWDVLYMMTKAKDCTRVLNGIFIFV